jgi:hypothetical protein
MIPCFITGIHTAYEYAIDAMKGDAIQVERRLSSARHFLTIRLATGLDLRVETHEDAGWAVEPLLLLGDEVEAQILAYKETPRGFTSETHLFSWWRASLDLRLPTGKVIEVSIAPELYFALGLDRLLAGESEETYNRFDIILGG